MNEYGKETRINEWTKLYFEKFEAQIERMEDEIIRSRKELLEPLSASSFSYYLYEQKVRQFRQNWEFYKTQEKLTHREIRRKLEKMIKERISEVLKQDNITLEDYPEYEWVRERKEVHEQICIKWIACLHFNVEISE